MDRALSFGAVADLYDQVRPSYPDPLIDDIAAALPGPTIVEVGAGTGKATAKLVARGLRVTCLEPDLEMARPLAARAPERILITKFEGWTPDTTYDGVVSAQAWHWTDPTTRLDRAAAALRSGGLLALFWNLGDWEDGSVLDAIDSVYDAHGISEINRPTAREDGVGRPETAELAAHPAFGGSEHRIYPWSQTWRADDFVAYLNTTSHHRIMDEPIRTSISAGIRALLGDRFETSWRTHAFLSHRR